MSETPKQSPDLRAPQAIIRDSIDAGRCNGCFLSKQTRRALGVAVSKGSISMDLAVERYEGFTQICAEEQNESGVYEDYEDTPCGTLNIRRRAGTYRPVLISPEGFQLPEWVTDPENELTETPDITDI